MTIDHYWNVRIFNDFQEKKNAADLFHPKIYARAVAHKKSHINILMDTWHEWKKNPNLCDVMMYLMKVREREEEERNLCREQRRGKV